MQAPCLGSQRHPLCLTWWFLLPPPPEPPEGPLLRKSDWILGIISSYMQIVSLFACFSHLYAWEWHTFRWQGQDEQNHLNFSTAHNSLLPLCWAEEEWERRNRKKEVHSLDGAFNALIPSTRCLSSPSLVPCAEEPSNHSQVTFIHFPTEPSLAQHGVTSE